MEKITESLAGRVAVLRLLPLSRREAEGRPDLPLPWETDSYVMPDKYYTFQNLWGKFLRGGFPELIVEPERDAYLWHASYVQIYLERDVRTLRQVGDLFQFQNFLQVLAARSSQLLNLSDISRDLGISVNTVKAWLSVLETTYQIIILRPYFANVGKRLVKTPKIYFLDVGMLCYLTGLKDPEHAATGSLGGAVFEAAVLGEIVKVLTHRGEIPKIYFWRTMAGTEVDIIIETNGKLIPLEVKLSATTRPKIANSIRRFKKTLGEKAMGGYVVHPGESVLPLGEGVTALPFAAL